MIEFSVKGITYSSSFIQSSQQRMQNPTYIHKLKCYCSYLAHIDWWCLYSRKADRLQYSDQCSETLPVCSEQTCFDPSDPLHFPYSWRVKADSFTDPLLSQSAVRWSCGFCVLCLHITSYRCVREEYLQPLDDNGKFKAPKQNIGLSFSGFKKVLNIQCKTTVFKKSKYYSIKNIFQNAVMMIKMNIVSCVNIQFILTIPNYLWRNSNLLLTQTKLSFQLSI